jgi:hypothetical protein
MGVEKRELYSSSNSDRWFLCSDPATGNVFIRHEASPASGQLSDLSIGAFLSRGELHPEHQALLDLIGTLVDSSPASNDRKRDRRPPTRSARRRRGRARP